MSREMINLRRISEMAFKGKPIEMYLNTVNEFLERVNGIGFHKVQTLPNCR